MTRLALALTRWSEHWIPSSLVIAVLLTGFTSILAVSGGNSPLDCVRWWGDGLWALSEFGMQMCLILMTGSILADSPMVARLMDRGASWPKTPRQAAVFMALASMIFCWLHWGFGIIASAFLARSLAVRQPRADFRVLAAVSYFGMGAVWHAGLSGSAPLLVATPGHFMAAKTGIIPLSETTFSAFNLTLTLLTMTALAALAFFIHPPERQATPLSAKIRADLAPPAPREILTETGVPNAWLRFLERTRAVNVMIGGLGLLWLIEDARAHGLSLTLNKVNLLFLALAALSHPSPAGFAAAGERAASYVHGVILQFPLYAGIYGIIKGAGLDNSIAQCFLSISGPRTFPLAVYWYSGILNYFVPSGGSKWAIEGPYIIEASRALGVPFSKTVLAYAWGDMLTDMIQPFFCLPLLAVARLEFKEIFGYTTLAFFLCSIIGTLAFWLF